MQFFLIAMVALIIFASIAPTPEQPSQQDTPNKEQTINNTPTFDESEPKEEINVSVTVWRSEPEAIVTLTEYLCSARPELNRRFVPTIKINERELNCDDDKKEM